MAAQPGKHVAGSCRRDGERKDRAQAGTNRVGIEQIGPRVGHHEGRQAGPVRAAKHGADVARLLHAFQHGHQRTGRQDKIFQPPLDNRGHAHHAFSPLAVGQPGEDRFAHVEATGAAAGQNLQQPPGLLAAAQFRADEDLAQLHAGKDCSR